MSPKSFKIEFKLEGLNELDRALKIAARIGVDIAPSLQHAADETIIPEAQGNVYDEFETTGDFPERIRSRITGKNKAEIVVWAIYAAAQEYGGTWDITPKQRRFFWAKFIETKEDMWKWLALSESYTLPPRPYLRPAIDSEKQFFMQAAADDLFLRLLRAL